MTDTSTPAPLQPNPAPKVYLMKIENINMPFFDMVGLFVKVIFAFATALAILSLTFLVGSFAIWSFLRTF